MAQSFDQLRKKEEARIKRQALRALRKARAAAERAGIALSEWEGEFLGSVEERVGIYGRAYADPEKAPAHGLAALSRLQGVKLKEIAAKASGKPPRRGFKSRKTGRSDRV